MTETTKEITATAAEETISKATTTITAETKATTTTTATKRKSPTLDAAMLEEINQPSHSKDAQAYKLASRLMELLNDRSVPQALWWIKAKKPAPGEDGHGSEDADTFAVDPKYFQSQVLDPYFRGTKYASFLRTMHKMGFARLSRNFDLPKGVVAYSCDLFQRDEPSLMKHIRMNNSGKQAQAAKAARQAAAKAQQHPHPSEAPANKKKTQTNNKTPVSSKEGTAHKKKDKAVPSAMTTAGVGSMGGTTSEEQMKLYMAQNTAAAAAATATATASLLGGGSRPTPGLGPLPMRAGSSGVDNGFVTDQLLAKFAAQQQQMRFPPTAHHPWQQFPHSSTAFPHSLMHHSHGLAAQQGSERTHALLAALSEQQHQHRRAAAELSLLQNALMRNSRGPMDPPTSWHAASAASPSGK